MKPVEFAPAARAELDAAAADYEREREGLGATFYSAVERTVRSIATFPEVGPPYQKDYLRKVDAWANVAPSAAVEFRPRR